MRYKFPEITHLDQVKAAIEDREEFIVAERDFGFVVNYMVNLIDSFPRINTKDSELNLLYAIRRECRGIKFDKKGKILARTLHKFFNLNERPETMIDNVDFDVPYVLFNKLDGSMIHPILFKRKVALCTKMGLTDVAALAQAFAEANSFTDYLGFCKQEMKDGYTPTFEWCSRKQRIVIDYPQDKLVLLAIRHMVTGAYKTMFEMECAAKPFGVPIVDQWQGSYNDIHDFVAKAIAMEGEEGYVIRFTDGHMLKQKNLWYVQLHKVKEMLSFEKDVWALVLDERQDDAKAFMDADDKLRIDNFAKDLYIAIDTVADRLKWIVTAEKDNLNDSKKKFVAEVIPQYSRQEASLLFRIWDGNESVIVVKEYIRKNCSTITKLNYVRPLLGGLKWEDY